MSTPAPPSAPSAPGERLRRPLRYLVRVPLLSLHLVVGLPLTLIAINRYTARWTLDGERVDHRAVRWWSGTLMRIFGMRVQRVGQPLRQAHLLVANHVSWIDIELVHSQRVVGFVAKSEISRWPLVGWLAGRAGTIYHQRGNNASLASVLDLMVGRLDSGQAVGAFPEGGTNRGDAVRTFHARIFQAAFEAQVPVQPVALRYGAGGSAQTTVAFAPGENFLQNFLRLLGEPARVAEVHFLAPITPGDSGRRQVAEQARESIVAAMES